MPPIFLSYHLAFLIPVAVFLAYRQFCSIPESEHKLWYYREMQNPAFVPAENTGETRSVPFVLQKEPRSLLQTKLNVESPVDMPIGQIFFNLVHKYNSGREAGRIVFSDAGEANGWLFYSGGGLRRKVLDPELPLKENGFGAKDVIYAVRAYIPQMGEQAVISGA